MYRPEERSEKAVVLFYDEKNDESYYTIGIWNGETGEFGEHFSMTCIARDARDITQSIHKEDIYEDTPENRQKIPIDIPVSRE